MLDKRIPEPDTEVHNHLQIARNHIDAAAKANEFGMDAWDAFVQRMDPTTLRQEK